MKKILFSAIVVAIFAGCYNDKYNKLYPVSTTVTCDTSTITYSHDILPIISASCYSPGNGCHDAAGASTSGYNYTNFAVLQSTALSGWLVTDINFAPTRGHNNMPKNGTKLSSCDIDKITRWVDEGALNN